MPSPASQAAFPSPAISREDRAGETGARAGQLKHTTETECNVSMQHHPRQARPKRPAGLHLTGMWQRAAAGTVHSLAHRERRIPDLRPNTKPKSPQPSDCTALHCCAVLHCVSCVAWPVARNCTI